MRTEVNMISYGYIENNKIVAPVAMRSRFKNIGGWHLLSDDERMLHDWYPCIVINSEFNSYTQVRETIPSIKFDEEKKIIKVAYVIVDKPIDTVKLEHKVRITSLRYDTEVSGIEVNGQLIETDRTSQTRIAQAHALVSIDPTTKIDWKVGNEWIVLDASTITAMALAIGKHVQECFSKEMRLHKQIDEAETIDDVLKINW